MTVEIDLWLITTKGRLGSVMQNRLTIFNEVKLSFLPSLAMPMRPAGSQVSNTFINELVGTHKMANEADFTAIDRALKIIPFNGKIKTWPRWRARFEAMAQVKRFLMPLKKKGNLPQDPEDYDTGMNAEQKAVAERAIKMKCGLQHSHLECGR